MLIEVRLPELAESMTSATLTVWLKDVGDSVTKGEAIAEVETEKTTVELEAPIEGIIKEIRVSAGTEDVEVGTVVAVLSEESNIETTVESQVRNRDATQESTSVEVDNDADMSPLSSEPVQSLAEDPSLEARPSLPVSTVASKTKEAVSKNRLNLSEVDATPLAHRMATVAGLDLSSLATRKEGGRVTKMDVDRALDSVASAHLDVGAKKVEAKTDSHSLETTQVSGLDFTDHPLTALRRVTARRMTEAKRTAPHFYLEIDCSVDRLLALRKEINVNAKTNGLTVNDFLVRAVALALKAVPLANSAWMENALRVFHRVDVAVAVNTSEGLVTPVIRSADTKHIQEIALELRELTERARGGRLKPDDYVGGTCTISNLGMFGVSGLFAILNPPQSSIIGCGAIGTRPVVRDGEVTVGSMMNVTLSADHRAIDGATGAELLREIKGVVEEPSRVVE